MRIFILVLIYSIFLISCTTEKQSEIYEFSIESVPNKQSTYLSKICKNIAYSPIEPSVPLIAGTSNIKCSDEFFIIQSRNVFYVVDDQGHIILVLNKIGNGPGEYNFVPSYDLDEVEIELFLYEMIKNKILIYSNNGSLSSEIDISSNITDMHLLGPNKLLLYCAAANRQSQYSHSVINFNNDTLWSLKSKFQYSPGSNIMDMELKTYKIGTKFYYKELMDDTLYCLSDNFEIHPHAIFNTGDLRVTPEHRNGPPMEYLQKGILFNNIFETPEHFIYEYSYQGNYKIMSEKLSGRTVLIDDSGFINDIDGGIPFFPNLQIDDKYLIQIVDAYTIKAWLKDDRFVSFKGNDGQKEKFRKMAESLTENSNPVIIKCQLK